MSLQEIMALPHAEKILLVEQIWDSLDHQELNITDAQKAELDRRKKLDEHGQMSWHTWVEVKSYLDSRST